MMLYVLLEYDINNDTVKIVDTNLKQKKIVDVIDDFLRLQIGAGEDSSDPDIRDIYSIRISLHLDDDTFICSHDCGNKGLREGILMRCVQLLSNGG